MENKSIQLQAKPSTLSRIKQASAVALATSTALVLTSNTNAAALLDFTAASGEIDGVKVAIVALIGALVTIIGIGIAWAYFKRTAK